MNILYKISDRPINELISPFSGEFIERDLENSFLAATWEDHKKSPRNAMFTGGLIFMAFSITDVLSGLDSIKILFLFLLRGFAGLFLIGSAVYIQRKKDYFAGFHLLSLSNQIVIATALVLMGAIRNLLFIHNAFHVFMVTLVFYQFVNNRFSFTLAACGFFPVAYFLANFGQYHLELIDIVRFVLYLVLANALGIPMLSSLNKNRRKEYIRYVKEQYLNNELESTVKELLQAQDEIKTLKGIIPICSHCKKIRDDKGYWKQIEIYVSQHSEAEFSHGVCPDCKKKHYPNFAIKED